MRKGPRKFHFSFEKSGLTRFGGLSLFQSFCKSLGLRHFLQLYVRWPKYHHKDYHPADLFLAHLFAIVTGIGRIENTQALIHNGLIPPLLGLPEFPHRDTLRSFLWRLGLRYSAIIDADTTALITYGSQEGTAVGYVPKRRHSQPSYAPIISSEGKTGLSLAMELRAGNVHASSGAWDFLKQVLDKLPSSIASTRTRVRLDGAFYDKNIVQSLDTRRLGYGIVARMYRPLKNRMVEARYQEFARGWEAAQFSYTPLQWREEHRFVAVRRPIALGNRRDPATTVHLQKVHLSSSFGNELGADGRGGLAFLLRPGVSRAFAARVQRLVCHGQDSYPQLVGQCRLHGNDPVGLRLGFGFPVSLFARRSSSLEYRYASPRTLVVAGRMDQARQSQPLDASVEVPSPKSLPQNPTCYHQGQGADLNQFATLWIASSVVGERN